MWNLGGLEQIPHQPPCFPGYKYHETPWETLEHFTTFTNETTNIATALVEAALGIWLVSMLARVAADTVHAVPLTTTGLLSRHV